MEVTAAGTRFVIEKLSILPKAVEGDESIAAVIRTAKLVRSIANSITPMIEMETGKRPILDLAKCVKNGQIIYKFYKKSMASRKLVQARSAFSNCMKRSILLEEGLRRLRNCSPNLPWNNKVTFLNRFSSDFRQGRKKIGTAVPVVPR